MSEARFVGALEQPGPKRLMNRQGAAQDGFTDAVFVHSASSALLRVLCGSSETLDAERCGSPFMATARCSRGACAAPARGAPVPGPGEPRRGPLLLWRVPLGHACNAWSPP